MEFSYPVYKKISGESEFFGLPVRTLVGILIIVFAPALIVSHFKLFLWGIRIDFLMLFFGLTFSIIIAKILKAKGYPQGFFRDLIEYHKRDEIFTGSETLQKEFLEVKQCFENIIISKHGVSFVYKLPVDDLRSYEDSELSDYYNSFRADLKASLNDQFEIQVIYTKQDKNNLIPVPTSENKLAALLQNSEKHLIDNSLEVLNLFSFNLHMPEVTLEKAKKIRTDLEKQKFLSQNLCRHENALKELFAYGNAEEIDFLKLDHEYVALLTLTELPSSCYRGMLDEIKERFNDFIIAMRVKAIDSLHYKKRLERKRDLENKFAIKRGQENIEATSRIGEINETFKIIADGESFLECEFSILLKASDQLNLQKQIDEIKNVFSRIDAKVYYEKYGSLKRIHKVLPLVSPYKDRALHLFSRQAIFLLPIHSKNQSERELLPLVNHECEIFYVDPFDRRLPNKNMIIVAGSGSGKSFLAVSLILKILKLEPNARFIVLDIGGSYKKATKILGGAYIDIDEKVSFQTIPSKLDRKALNNLLMLISEFSAARDKRDRADIYKALKVFEKSDSVKSLTNFCKILENVNTDLSTNLSLYTQDGPYGEIFDRENSLSLKNQITCLDLKNINEYLASDEEKKLFLMTLLSQVWQEFANSDDLAVPKYLILDECWNLINSNSQWIGSAARTFRKHNASLISITQSIEDYNNLSSQAIVNNSAIKVILKQNTKTQVDKVCDVFGFSEKEKEQIESLQVEKGLSGYSEIFLARSGLRSVKGAYFPDKATYLIATSDPRDNINIEEEKKKGGSYMKAIQTLAFLFIAIFSFTAHADMFGGDIPFLVAITSNTMQTLSTAQQVLKTTKEQLSNAIKTYDEIHRTYNMMEGFYKSGSDGLQLKDIDLLLGRGTANALTGIYDNISKGKGVKRENLVALRDGVDDAAFVNDKLLTTTQNFSDNLNKAEAIKRMYGDSDAKSAIELGNLYTKALLDLNIVEILQRHTDMEFKTDSEKFNIAENIRKENEFRKINYDLDQKLKKQPFSYKDPMRTI